MNYIRMFSASNNTSPHCGGSSSIIRKRSLIIISLLACLAIINPKVHAANIIKRGPCDLTIDGDFDTETSAVFISSLKKMPPICTSESPISMITVWFNSSGGDVQAAMDVGRTIRRVRASTVIMPGNSCASACVLAFIGGVKRLVLGEIGIHRPFPDLPPENAKAVRKSREMIDESIRQYLSEMNIPNQLLSEMNAVSPGDIKWLRDGELYDGDKLSQLQITGDDPVYDDEVTASIARKLGITESEYYKRLQMSKRICKEPFDPSSVEYRYFMKCKYAIIHGMH